jgi:hypothetical protein
MADDDFLVETVEYAREHCNSNPYWSYDSSTRQEFKSFLKGKSKNKAPKQTPRSRSDAEVEDSLNELLIGNNDDDGGGNGDEIDSSDDQEVTGAESYTPPSAPPSSPNLELGEDEDAPPPKTIRSKNQRWQSYVTMARDELKQKSGRETIPHKEANELAALWYKEDGWGS